MSEILLTVVNCMTKWILLYILLSSFVIRMANVLTKCIRIKEELKKIYVYEEKDLKVLITNLKCGTRIPLSDRMLMIRLKNICFMVLPPFESQNSKTIIALIVDCALIICIISNRICDFDFGAASFLYRLYVYCLL